MDDHRRKALFSNPFLGTSEQDIVEKRNAEKRVLAEQIAERKLQKEEAKRKEQEQERKDAEKLARFVIMNMGFCSSLLSCQFDILIFSIFPREFTPHFAHVFASMASANKLNS